MEINFEKLMTSKSDEGLQAYLDNRTKYTSDAVEAAISEMQKRGRTFSEEELSNLRQAFQTKRRATENDENEDFGFQWKKNVVSDEYAPEYYSERAIYMFSVFFGVIYGAVLLALNCRTTDTKKGVWEVIAFGVVYTGLQLWLLSMIPRNTVLTFASNMGGALLLNYFFWRKNIGKDTKYRVKPIWKPLIIGILIYTPFFLAAIYGGAE
jgi:hypothetical protein